MARAFHLQYDGTPGIEGLDHLAEFEKHVRSYPNNSNCPATRVRTEVAWLAHSYEAHSPFQTWCESELLPIIQALEVAIRTGDLPARQAAADAANAAFAVAKDDFRKRFGRSNSKDLFKLLTIDFQQSGTLIDIIKAINKCSTLYAVNSTSLPPQYDVVDSLLDKLPPALSTKVRLGLANVPDTQTDPRFSFKNVSAILQKLMQTQDSWLWLQFGANGAGAAAGTATAVMSGSRAGNLTDFNNLVGGSSAVSSAAAQPAASATDAAFAHLSDVDKCRALAVVSPQGICPVHKASPHALKDCPFVVGTKHGKPGRRSADAHAAAVSEFEQEPDGTDKLSEMLQHLVFDTVSQAFAAHTGGGHSQQHQHQHQQRNQQYGGQDGPRHYSKASAQQFRPQYPACDVCHAPSHPTSTCWVIRPDKCQDTSTLIAHYSTLPAECRPLFMASLKRYGMYESIVPQLQAAGADVFPPRPDGSNAGPSNHGPRSFFTLAGCSTVAEVSDVATPSVAPLPSVDAHLHSTSMAAATQPSSSSLDSPIEVCGSCGHPCDCKVSVAHDSMGQMQWHCPQQISSACTADKPVNQDHVLHAFVAKYAGPLPASYTQGELGKCSGMAVTRGQAQQQQPQPQPQPNAGPPAAQPPAKSRSPALPPQQPVHAAVVAAPPSQPSSLGNPASSGIQQQHVPLPGTGSRVQGSSNADVAPSGQQPAAGKRGPVSFAPVIPSVDLLTGISRPGVSISGRGEGALVDKSSKGWVVLPFETAKPLLRDIAGPAAAGSDPASVLAAVFTGQTDVYYDAVACSSVTPLPPASASSGSDHLRFRELRGGVCRLAQPEGRPQDCVFIAADSDSSSALALPRITFTDSCSDNCFMRRQFAQQHGIACEVAPNSTLHMRTVGGVVSKPTVTTELSRLLFRWGTSQEHHIRCNFIAIDDDALPYDIILGTPILRLLACAIDFLNDSLYIRPKYVVNGDRSTHFSIPIVTTEPCDPSKRSAVVDPAVASTQVTVVDSGVPLALSTPVYQAGQPLFSTCCASTTAMSEQGSEHLLGPSDEEADTDADAEAEVVEEELVPDTTEDEDMGDAADCDAPIHADESEPPAVPASPAVASSSPGQAGPSRRSFVPIPPPPPRPAAPQAPPAGSQLCCSPPGPPRAPLPPPPPPPGPPPSRQLQQPLPFGFVSTPSPGAVRCGAAGCASTPGSSAWGSAGAGPSGLGPSSSSAAGSAPSYLDTAAPLVFPTAEQLPDDVRSISSPAQVIPAMVQGIMALAAAGGQGLAGVVTMLVHFAVYSTAAMVGLSNSVETSRGANRSDLDAGQLDRLWAQLAAIAVQGSSVLDLVLASAEGDFAQAVAHALRDVSVMGRLSPRAQSFMQQRLYGLASIDAQPPDAWVWCPCCGFVPDTKHHACIGGRPPRHLPVPASVLDTAAADIARLTASSMGLVWRRRMFERQFTEMQRGVQSAILPPDAMDRLPPQALYELQTAQHRALQELQLARAKAMQTLAPPPPPRPPPGSPPDTCKGKGPANKRPPHSEEDDDEPLLSNRRAGPGAVLR